MLYEITRWRWPGRQLMLLEHFWAGVHFICSWTPPHIKLPKRVKGHLREQTCFWRPRFYLYLSLFRRVRVFFFNLCTLQASVSFPPRCLFFVFLFAARTDFSTRELSPPRQMWHALRSWRGWLAWDEHERERRSAYLWRRCTWRRKSEIRKLGVVVF